MSPTLLFQKLRGTLLRNAVRHLLAHSLARLLSMLACSVLIWGLLFGLSWAGLHEVRVRGEIDLDLRVIELVLDVMFFVLSVMLTFSTGIILYSSLFASDESLFLMASPIPDDHVFAYKLQGGIAFSSWAFVLLGSPILIAFGLEIGDGAPWYYYAVMPLFFLGFILMPGSLGALGCMLLVNLVPRQRRQIFIGILVLTAMAAVAWIFSQLRQVPQTGISRTWFEDVLGDLAIFGGRWVPFHWIARGLKMSALGRPVEMLYYLALIWGNGLFAYLATLWLARHLYRRGLNRAASGGTLRRRYGGAWLDALVSRLVFFLDAQTRHLIVKDFRTFRRDPAQWAQIVIFFGLAVLYFPSMRRFYEQDLDRAFKNFISLLMLTAWCLFVCVYTSRFVFPLLSLEGRKFWILGLLPMDRARLIWGKFVFSATGSFLAVEFLSVLSDAMLGMPPVLVVLHAVTAGTLALALTGLSVGLGACLPDFRETDPSKITMGFGGMLNVIAGLLLLVSLVTLMAVPVHIVYARQPEGPLAATDLPWWIWVPHVSGLLLGLAAAALPLRAGVRTLRAMEF
jgi:ABC-2 type transport system permease protein